MRVFILSNVSLFISSTSRIIFLPIHHSSTGDSDATAEMKTSNPLGDLAVLPRELRDEIFSYLVPMHYSICWEKPDYFRCNKPAFRGIKHWIWSYLVPMHCSTSGDSSDCPRSNPALRGAKYRLWSYLVPMPMHCSTCWDSSDCPRSNPALRGINYRILSYLVPMHCSTCWDSSCCLGNKPLFKGIDYPLDKPVSRKIKLVERSTEYNLAILRLSKRIYEEAVSIFYSKGIFGFDITYIDKCDLSKYPSTNITNRIMNVQFSLTLFFVDILKTDTEAERQLNASVSLGSVPHGVVALFTGNSVQRNSALIEFNTEMWCGYSTAIIPSPLFQVLKQLTGFRTVTLRVGCYRDWSDWYGPPAGTNAFVANPWSDTGERGKRWAGLEPLLREFTAALGPSLGPGVIGEFEHEGGGDTGWRRLVFHPRDYIAEMSKVTSKEPERCI